MNKRMRVFAGPNGSGKSSIIKSLRETETPHGKQLDFGIYINADDITKSLTDNNQCAFDPFSISPTKENVIARADKSGLISNETISLKELKKSFTIENNTFYLTEGVDKKQHNRIAQILADFIREELLSEGKKFTFETVFSHKSKIEFIVKAKNNGYKVYLYFVSTESPKINVDRVKIVRVSKGGHDVDRDKIISRYNRAMGFMYEAAQYCHRVYFFDNSSNDDNPNLFTHFEVKKDNTKDWTIPNKDLIPNWFYTFYSNKVKKAQSSPPQK